MSKEGVSTFEFDAFEFCRHSKSGQSRTQWAELKEVIVLDDVYIIVGKQKGMAPIPVRCFSSEQIKLFESYCANKLRFETVKNGL
jgi:hypothetical protein